MSKMINQINPSAKLRVNYAKIEKDVSAIITRGAESLKAAYKRQALVTNWEVGRYLKETLPLDGVRSANNARIISRLGQKFGRPADYFYRLMKFYRLYPELPAAGPLTWSHYKVLVGIADARSRQRYERLALRKNISGKILGGLIANDKVKKVTQGRGVMPYAPNASLALKRGKLYHYKVSAPVNARSNTGTATLDVGFETFRDIPLNKRSALHAGHMACTVKTEKDIFAATYINTNKDLLYTYVAAVERVIDGDTLIAMIDLGLRTKTRQKLRLRGIDCPELATVRGNYVRDYVKKLLDQQEFIIVKTYWDDKWGRMLADIFYLPKEKDAAIVAEKGVFLNQLLLDKGMALPYDG